MGTDVFPLISHSAKEFAYGKLPGLTAHKGGIARILEEP